MSTHDHADESGGLWGGGSEPAEPADPDVRLDPVDDEVEAQDWNRPDPRERPRDPAGSFPRYFPDDLLPRESTPLTVAPEAPPKPATVPGDPVGSEPSDTPISELPEPPHASRFQFVLGGLIALAVAGLAALVLAGLSTDDNGGSRSDQFAVVNDNWSKWQPTPGAGDGPKQIADHVGPEYKQEGQQIVAVTGGPLQYQNIPLQVALRQTAAQGGSIKIMDGTAVLYRLCGLGKNCSIAEGKPSIERHLLLQREALELALYSFHYIDNVRQVVVFMPPSPQAKATDPPQAIYFRPQDVAQALGKPLTQTLTPNTPTVSSMTTNPDATTVRQETDQATFDYTLSPSNTDASGFLVLQPLG